MKQLTKSILAVLYLAIAGITAATAQQAETGVASFYHDKFVGRKTANGEIFRQELFTAAHKTLPLGTWVKVTNLSNDSTVVVRINDRMPLWNKRSIDLTEAAAEQLNYITKGLTKVLIEIIPDPFKHQPVPRPADLPTDYLIVPKAQQIEYPATHLIACPDPLDYMAFAQTWVGKKKRR